MANANDLAYGYGNWYLTVLYVALFGLFLAFIPLRKKAQRLPSSIYLAFIIALYAEMYGFPLTIYFLSWAFSYQQPLTHVSGHILSTIIGDEVFFTFVHPLSTLMMAAGIMLVIFGWKSIHGAQNQLRTTGLYAYVRHPQYLGFLVTTLGMIVQWATIPTLIMWPLLVILYYRLAKHEEKEMYEKFGEKFIEYKNKVPMMMPYPKLKWKHTSLKEPPQDADELAGGFH